MVYPKLGYTISIEFLNLFRVGKVGQEKKF